MKDYFSQWNKVINPGEDLNGMFIPKTPISHCQNCGRDFSPQEIVYFAPSENNIQCEECSRIHKDRELRIYKAQ